MQNLSDKQKMIHQRALELAGSYRKIESELIRVLQKIESELIRVLQKIDECKLYKTLGHPSLFMYATQALGLSESVAYAFITVSRKCKQVRELQIAIDSQKLSVSKAVRITSALNEQDPGELIEFAQQHTSKQIDLEMAKRNPAAQIKSSAKPVSEEVYLLKLGISKKTYEKLLRVQALEAQRQKSSKFEDAVDAALEEYLERRDPVRKAKRNSKKAKPCLNKVSKVVAENGRVPPTAAQKHFVNQRDEGRCTHLDAAGKRCNQDRWVETHHIVPVSRGGSNDPENLTTLCSFHHDLVHQLSFPIEGLVNWLRSPRPDYLI